MKHGHRALLAAALLVGASCQSAGEAYDYGPYLAHMPRSILVLPPLDRTAEVAAPYEYLSTVTRPLAERGYYVFPVAMVDGILKENGLPTPGEMHQISLAKIDEVFGADAVLYLLVTKWGTTYQVLDSPTTVAVEARLVDVGSGAELWRGSAEAAESSNNGGGGIGGMLVGALVNQLASSVHDRSADVARGMNAGLYANASRGLLLGHRHPEFAADQAARRSAPAAAQVQASAR